MGVLVASRHPPDALDETAFPRWYRRSAEPGALIRRLAVRHFDSRSRAKPMLRSSTPARRGAAKLDTVPQSPPREIGGRRRRCEGGRAALRSGDTIEPRRKPT